MLPEIQGVLFLAVYPIFRIFTAFTVRLRGLLLFDSVRAPFWESYR